jgi:hypothetical protein
MTRVRQVLVVARIVVIAIGFVLAAVGVAMDNRQIVWGAILALGASIILRLLLGASARRAGPPEPAPGRDPLPPES